MGYIVDGRRRIRVTEEKRVPLRNGAGATCAAFRAHTKIGGKALDLTVYRPGEGALVAGDLALVQEFFGTNISDTLRLAVRLAANAIRANKALPEVR